MSNLLTQNDREQMLRNGARSAAGEDHDAAPVVKLFAPDGSATWLLSELDPADPDLAFGLCDLGLGFPELGYVRISDILAVKGALGLAVERDMAFRADKSLAAYARLAKAEGRILP